MKRAWRLAALASSALLTLAVTASPAQANTAEGYVAGASTITDDWGDEGTLSASSHRYSAATELWQMVLYADGAIESNGTAYDLSDIDCDFGPNTTYATKDWQRKNSLTADGIVGTGTFSKADNRLVSFADTYTGYIYVNAKYVGAKHTVYFYRSPTSDIYWPKAYFVPNTDYGFVTWNGGIAGKSQRDASYTSC